MEELENLKNELENKMEKLREENQKNIEKVGDFFVTNKILNQILIYFLVNCF